MIASRLLCGISALALATGAHAQTNTTSGTSDTSAAAQTSTSDQTVAPQTSAPDAAIQDVVVTGSRVARNGNDAPQPVTMVSTADLLKTQPTTLADGLNSLPIFAGSRGASSSVNTGTTAGGNGAANQLSLRNLGANRTLILLDGQRVPPALFTGVVDVDIMPEMLIQRVDIVTGGVSAVYGSDAISGVVNFIVDKNFNGLKAEVQKGISQLGDAPQDKIGIAYGTKLFGDRGHFEASYTRFDSTPLWYRTDRPTAYDYAYGGLGTAASPYTIYGGTRNSSTSAGGLITSGALKGQEFATNGVLTPFNAGTPTGATNLSIGGDGVYQDPSLGASQHNNQFFSRFDFDVTDSLKFHLEGMGSVKQNTAYSNYGQVTNATISACNAFLTTAQQTTLGCTNRSPTATGQPTFTYSRFLSDGQRIKTAVQQDQYYVNTGLDGKSGKFDYGVDASYGWSTLHNTISGNINNQTLSAELDAVVNPANGQVVCRSALTGANPGCTPLNLFGPSAESATALSNIYGSTSTRVRNTDLDLNAHIGGDLFDLGAGAARFALSGEFRRNSYEQSTDYGTNTLANCTGLIYNCVPGTSTTATPTALYQNVFANRTEVSQVVKEVALEAAVPLLRDSKFGKSLELNGAARYTDYNTSGNYWTWKIGANYAPTDSLHFRGTLSRDIRAPTLYDLYQSPSSAVVNNADLLTNTSPGSQGITTGNPNLKAEIGRTFTAGAVWKPSSIRGFSAALDYYNIEVTNAITTVSGFDPSIQQACYASGGSSPYCALQVRPNGFTNTSAANAATLWYSTNINIARVKTYGVDGELNYTTNLLAGPASVRLFTTWQPHIYYYQPGIVTYDGGGAAYNPVSSGTATPSPRWRVNGMIHVEPVQGFQLDIRERWRSGLRYNANPTLVFAQTVPAAAYTDLTATIHPQGAGNMEFFVNVSNLLDKSPPVFQIGSLPGQGFVPGDDFLGRYFTVGARARW